MRENGAVVSLRDILEIENDEEILSFRCPDTGYFLWPMMRNIFMRFIMSDMLYETPLVSERRNSCPFVAYGSILKAFAHNVLRGRTLKGPILISSYGNHVIKDGKYLNRLSDYFVFALYEKTVTFEALSTEWHWPFPRHNERVLFNSPLLAISSLYGKFAVSERHQKAAEALVKFVAFRTRKLLERPLPESRIVFLTKSLSRCVASFFLRKIFYTRLFQRTGARLLICQCACYGGYASIMNVIARELGVVTCEYQHGAVSAGHDAYNFAKALCLNDDYKKTLPQYFLGYGRWWTGQISAPMVKLNIGNPDRTETLRNVALPCFEKRDIIVLGDGIETEKYLSLCRALVEELGAKHRVVFRPHPLERARLSNPEGRKSDDVAIEWEKGICEAFETAEIVVSELSTGLFEAVGIASRIFLWETPKTNFCYPHHPFATFSDADDLVARIREGKSGRVDASTAEEFWAPNWKENYLAFLESVCPGILDSGEA